jgi:hypothetical protein
VNAAELATALLDEGEDPKDFLRRHAPRLRMPTIDQVEITCTADWEDDRPDGNFCEQADVDYVYSQIAAGNVWGWASVTVTAKFTTEDDQEVEGHDYLGGCSYASRADFMQPGGYYADMKQEAYEDLCKQLEKLGYQEV